MPMNVKRLDTVNIFLMLLLGAIFGIRSNNSLLFFIAFFGSLVLLFIENLKKKFTYCRRFFRWKYFFAF
jgi:hypothetical protein